jgi:hypothetical protein
MGSSQVSHELAPVVLLRAAAFPIRKLTGFGDPVLAERARAARPGEADQDFQVAYAGSIERERLLLREETASDAGFMRALTIANPQLAQRAANSVGRQLRVKKSRRLHRALFRHLSRAVGRTEPADLWAGVAMTDWSGDTTGTVVRECPQVVLVHPDLRPFQTMIRGLARRQPYLWSERWRANATLIRQNEGGWRYSARLPDGRVVDRATAPNALADALFPALPSGAVPLREMVDQLRGTAGLDPAALGPVLESYVTAGVLVGGLDLPARFSTPWEALDRTAARLAGADREVWCDAVASLRRVCVEIEQQLPEMAPEKLAGAVEAAEATVVGLAEELEVVIAPPRAVLRGDLRLGFRVSLGPEVRERLVTALAEYDDPMRSGSEGRTLRRALAASLRAQIGPGRPVAEVAIGYQSARGQVDAPPPQPASPASDPMLAQLDGVDGAPFGCLLASLRESTGGEVSLDVRGVFDEVSPLYGRFAPLWGSVVPAPKDPLYGWLRQQLQHLEDGYRLRVAELAGPCEANPNALAAPRLTHDVFELWGTTEAGSGLVGAEVLTDPASGSPVVRMPGEPVDVVLFSFASADVARGDRISELLLASSRRVAPSPSFEALTLPTETDLDGPGPSPAVALRGGARLRSPRTVLRGEELRQLLGADGPELYVRWQQLAAENRWPALVRVRVLGEHTLLLPTASPLAVEAVLGRIPVDAATVVVEEAEAEPWLMDQSGDRYVSELAVPFKREPHIWSTRAAMER